MAQPSWVRYRTHYMNLLDMYAEGRVIPFLGAGAGLCDRGRRQTFRQGKVLPDGRELSKHMAEWFHYPHAGNGCTPNLAEVTQYGATVLGAEPLYRGLREVFDADYPPTRVHRALASLPGKLREKGAKRTTQLIITTNYDDALERAFHAAGEPLDVLWYIADGEDRGKFHHRAADGTHHLVEDPSTYTRVNPEVRSVLLKMHGAVDRAGPDRDSYVITEDHYIDFMVRGAAEDIFPVYVAREFVRSHLLFLGYSLRDWNLRALLHRVWATRERDVVSWAVQHDPDPFHQEYWGRRKIRIIPVALKEYVAGLDRLLEEYVVPARAR